MQADTHLAVAMASERSFGLVFAAIFTLLAALVLLRGQDPAQRASPEPQSARAFGPVGPSSRNRANTAAANSLHCGRGLRQLVMMLIYFVRAREGEGAWR